MAFRTQRGESADTSIEHMDSSIEMRSPGSPVCAILPRKLRFASPSREDDGDDTEDVYVTAKNNNNNVENELLPLRNRVKFSDELTPKTMSISPPYRKVRALRLFDTPATPKTILEKSSGKCLNHLSALAATAEASKQPELYMKAVERPRSLPLHNRALDNIMQQQTANVNPFTPDSKLS